MCPLLYKASPFLKRPLSNKFHSLSLQRDTALLIWETTHKQEMTHISAFIKF